MDSLKKSEFLSQIVRDFKDEIAGFSFDVAKKIKNQIFTTMTRNINATSEPIVFFTAGAPACGKSETVKYLLEIYPNTVRIDPDEFRELFPYYIGSNAENYQKPCTHIISHCYKNSVARRFDIIHDTNFADTDTAIKNIAEAFKKGYWVQIIYVYLDPINAWKHAQRRVRKILPEVFCHNYFKVRSTIKSVLTHPGFQGKPLRCRAYVYEEIPGKHAFSVAIHENVTAETLDVFVPFNYSISDLKKIAV
ncbi:zeta toxin family protein [Klebsiella sp. BIGb0407]|uniref:zeta toxin family protein n=1 Tax=Klebsiella sp. BIGb0407 TaxID=2940603 RepID=UPI00216A46D7|nr:zeta toxin family protein [Klebsiella sp. BIGb0407]